MSLCGKFISDEYPWVQSEKHYQWYSQGSVDGVSSVNCLDPGIRQKIYLFEENNSLEEDTMKY